MHLTKSQHFTDGLSRYGRFSPSMDQGYHTLVSPSPSGQQQSSIPATWNTAAPSSSSTSTTNGANGCGQMSNSHLGNGDILNGSKGTMYRAGPLFDRISDELMVKIFDWLDSSELCNIARVCKRFESVIWSPNLWKIIKIKGMVSTIHSFKCDLLKLSV